MTFIYRPHQTMKQVKFLWFPCEINEFLSFIFLFFFNDPFFLGDFNLQHDLSIQEVNAMKSILIDNYLFQQVIALPMYKAKGRILDRIVILKTFPFTSNITNINNIYLQINTFAISTSMSIKLNLSYPKIHHIQKF